MSAPSVALLDAVRGLHWPARRPSTSHAQGVHAATRKGVSPEFTEYRRYRQGDDPRTLDWRLLARSDRAYVRVATDRADLSTTMLLDASASMAYPTLTRAKWEAAWQIAVALAAVAGGDGDPVGLTVPLEFGTSVHLPARSRRGVIAEMLRRVEQVDPEGTEPLGPALAALRTRRVAVVTDLLGDADALLVSARMHVAQGREVYVIHVIAPEELEPPRRTMLSADPEQPSLHRVMNASARTAYLRAFGEWREAAARAWRAAGAAYVAVVCDEPVPHAVRRIVSSATGAALAPESAAIEAGSR